jgi:hypothetical protein
MKPAWLELSGSVRMATRLVAAFLAVAMIAGCRTPSYLRPVVVPNYEPSNVYRANPNLPPSLRRLAVLPLTASSSVKDPDAGIEALDPLIHSELARLQRFEVIIVTTEQMRQWTGKPSWRSDEALPASFFAQIRDGTGCDAVLFSQLTRYQPYEPLAIGWKSSLVTVAQGPNAETKILWSVDDLVDAGNPDVARSAKAYYSQHLNNESPASDSSTILASPRKFGQYSLSVLLGTLPERQK